MLVFILDAVSCISLLFTFVILSHKGDIWLKRRSIFNRQKVTLHFFIPYIIVMLITHMVGFFTSYQMLKAMEIEVESIHIASLKQTEKNLHQRIEEIDLIVKQISNSSKVINYQNVSEPHMGSDTYKTIEITKDLFDYKQSNNFIYDYYLYYEQSDTVISVNSSHDLPSFYQYKYGYTDMSVDQWRDYLTNKFHNKQILPSQQMNVEHHKQSMLTYIHSLGLPYSTKGSIVILINNKELDKMLGNGLDYKEGWAYISNDDGEIISSTAWGESDVETVEIPTQTQQGLFKKNIQSKDMTITYLKSDQNNWSYVMVQPTGVAMNNLIRLQKIALTTLYISLTFGSIIALYLAKRSSRPLDSIVKQVVEKSDEDWNRSQNAYGLIEDTISRLFSDKDELENKIKEQIPILRQTFFDQLLTGEFTSEQMMKNMLHHTGINLDGTFYSVIIIHFRDDQSEGNEQLLMRLDKTKVLAKEIILKVDSAHCHVHDLKANEIAVLFSSKTENIDQHKEDINEYTAQINDILAEKLKIRSLIAIGGIYGNVFDISRTYEEAKRTIQFIILNNTKAFLRYDEIPEVKNIYHYPIEVESRLINFVKAGDIQDTQKLLKQLFTENFQEKSLSVPTLQLFLYDLSGTLMKVIEFLDKSERIREKYIERLFKQLDKSQDLEKKYQIIEDKYVNICKVMNDRKKSQNVQLRDDLIEYVHLSYHHPDLSLAEVANHFQISEVYLSNFFKEQTGEKFSDCIERIRMEHARELLKEDILTINEIAIKVGYYTANTFGRAFKRVHGVSATSYKKTIK